jgi:hypothetical protein
MQLGIWPESILIFQSGHSPATYPIFSPHSPYARSISELSSGVFGAMLGIFIVVAALVTYCIHKFRATPDQSTSQPTYGNTISFHSARNDHDLPGRYAHAVGTFCLPPAAHDRSQRHGVSAAECDTVNGRGGLRGPNLSDVGNRLTQQQMILRILNGGRNYGISRIIEDPEASQRA